VYLVASNHDVQLQQPSFDLSTLESSSMTAFTPLATPGLASAASPCAAKLSNAD
jgi:hypothetical protein